MSLRSVVSTGARLLTGLQTTPPPSNPKTNQPTRTTGHSTVDTFTGPSKGVPDNKKYVTTSGGKGVVSQREAGDYYCEHTAWALNYEANKKGSSIRSNSSGEKLVGFLHVPGKNDQPGPNRHKETIEVVGGAFRGYVDTIRSKDPQTNPVKLMLTGYGAFGSVTDNPTGDFVGNKDNIDATMKAAFGTSLVDGKGKPVNTPAGTAYQYEVKDAKGQVFKVQVLAKKLEIQNANGQPTNHAIDAGPESVQRLMRDFGPQAALSLGVNPNEPDNYQVVVRSDLGGADFKKGGALSDNKSKRLHGVESNHGVIHNEALGKAILLGNGKYQVRAGETLSAIAARNNTTVEELKKLNGITDPKTLQAGSVIRVR